MQSFDNHYYRYSIGADLYCTAGCCYHEYIISGPRPFFPGVCKYKSYCAHAPFFPEVCKPLVPVTCTCVATQLSYSFPVNIIKLAKDAFRYNIMMRASVLQKKTYVVVYICIIIIPVELYCQHKKAKHGYKTTQVI